MKQHDNDFPATALGMSFVGQATLAAQLVNGPLGAKQIEFYLADNNGRKLLSLPLSIDDATSFAGDVLDLAVDALGIEPDMLPPDQRCH